MKTYAECNGVRIMADGGLFGPLVNLQNLPLGYLPVTPISPIAVRSGVGEKVFRIIDAHGPIKVSYNLEKESLFTFEVRGIITNEGRPTQHFRHEVSLFEIGSRKEAH